MRLFSFIVSLCLATLLSTNSWAGLFGDGNQKVLSADEAIQFDLEENDQFLLIHWQLADTVYLYKDKVKLQFPDKSLYEHHQFLETPTTIEDPAFGEVAVFYNSATTQIDRSQLPTGNHELTLKYQGCLESIGLCYPPQKTKINISQSNTAPIKTTSTKEQAPDLEDAGAINSFLKQAGTLLVIGTFLVLGIGLTFTPCVLPMVPILSSVIAGQKELTPAKGFTLSTVYVLGMAITFALAGVLVGMLGARFNLQIYMQQPWVLGLFAGLFVLLALSMFGFYELRLPRFIQDPLDQLNRKQQGGNLIGVFLMGALSAVVVSPCVSAPLAGALVYISTTGDAVLGGFALFALGLGMGLPLIAIGTTGASMLPKAGAWMEQVKVFFGVLLIGVALWILGRVLPESIYLAGWALLLGIYAAVLGAFEAAENTKQRLVKGTAILMFVVSVLLIAKLLDLSAPTTATQTSSTSTSASSLSSEKSTGSIFTEMSDKQTFEETLLKAKANEQLVMVDLYADWCIECKIMAKGLFMEPEVQQALEPFVSIKLDITEFNEFHKSFLEEKGVFGPPAILFYGLDGNEIKEARILGEIQTAAFLNHIDQFDP